jgi:hypothetical protein
MSKLSVIHTLALSEFDIFTVWAVSVPFFTIGIDMKLLVSLLLLFYLNESHAFSMQLGTGGLTPHFTSSKKNYCNQWNNTGIIANKTYYIRFMGEKYGFTYMQGNDSICSPIEGTFIHYLMYQTDWNELGITFGGYAYNEQNWKEHEEKTPSGIDAPQPVHLTFGGREVVPVLALDFAIHLIRRERWSLKLNNLFTPIIWNHSVAWEYRF